MKSSHKTRFLVQMAVLAAMSVLLVYLIHFPIFPAAPFLEYDPADIPILIGTFMFGPVGGLIITAVACVLQGVTVSSASGIIGILMHFFATGSFVLVAGNIYKKNRTRKGAVIALVACALTMTITMLLWNIVMTPIFMGTPREAVLAMILPVILPFNLIKAGANAVITFFVYKSVSKVLGMEIQEKSKVAKTEA
ncbi:ECF transporter S component [Eubacterium aggregans]|uniref:ECF transporter S component n=1 Tax=Eubacterium aggregans TaxID=81409 RepID=UPI003F385880